MKTRAAMTVIAALGVLAAAGAAESAKGPAKASAQKRAAVLQAIVDCRAMTDTTARLACYDAAAAKLDEAEATGQVVVVDKDQARQVRREVFGLQLPSLDIFSAAAPKAGPAGTAAVETVDRITEVVKSATRVDGGRWSVELETGAVWRQIDDSELAGDPHPGSKVELRKAALGSFFMKIDGQPAIRAHRDR